jgi:hypothetical protein
MISLRRNNPDLVGIGQISLFRMQATPHSRAEATATKLGFAPDTKV